MTLTVEDGTGLEDANAYASVETADAYFAERTNAIWAALTNEAKESAIIAATQYADFRWGDELRSRPLESGQALEMPRRSLRDRYGNEIEGLPRDWVRGVLEYAVQASQNPLTNAPVRRTEREQKSRRVTVGPITTATSFVTSQESKPSSSSRDFIVYPAADELCKRFIAGFGLSGRVIR